MEKPTKNLTGEDDPCIETAYPSAATPVQSPGSLLANMGSSGIGGGRSVPAEQNWFKHWASSSLLSNDLYELTDHEERIWWRLLAFASLEDPRWSARVTALLAEKCRSTPAKMGKALATFESKGMILLEGGCAFLINAHRWNEESNNRPPSASAEAARARKAAQRERDRERDMSQGVTRDGHELVTSDMSRDSHDHKEEEKEKEEEQEKIPRKRGASAKPESVPFEEEDLRERAYAKYLSRVLGNDACARIDEQVERCHQYHLTEGTVVKDWWGRLVTWLDKWIRDEELHQARLNRLAPSQLNGTAPDPRASIDPRSIVNFPRREG